MPEHGMLQLHPGGSRRKLQHLVEREEAKEIAVGPGRGTGASVAEPPEVVRSHSRPVGQLPRFRYSLGQAAAPGWDVPGNPMDPGAHGRIGIVADQSEASGSLRRFTPAQGRGEVLPVTGVDGWNQGIGRERGTFDPHVTTSFLPPSGAPTVWRPHGGIGLREKRASCEPPLLPYP